MTSFGDHQGLIRSKKGEKHRKEKTEKMCLQSSYFNENISEKKFAMVCNNDFMTTAFKYDPFCSKKWSFLTHYIQNNDVSKL